MAETYYPAIKKLVDAEAAALGTTILADINADIGSAKVA